MKKQNFKRKQYDNAYGCFLFCGVTALLISAISYIPIDTGAAGGLSYLLLVPMSIASLAVIVVGIGYSVRLYHHWPLVFLSLLSVLFLAEMATEYGSVTFYNLVPVLYGANACIFSLVWFLVLRKHYGQDI